jgi:hypothetical protein
MLDLALPNDYRDLLFVSAPDYRSIEGMLTINQASADWLQGKIDPFDHVEPVEELVYSNQFSPLLLP